MPDLRRQIAAEIYRDVLELMRDYGAESGTIAAMAFGATLDQLMIEKYGLTEQNMAEQGIT